MNAGRIGCIRRRELEHTGESMEGVEIAVEQTCERHRSLRIAGPLRPGWCGNLASGLAGLGIGIESGRALKLGSGGWSADFTLCCPRDRAPTGETIGSLLGTISRGGCSWRLELLAYRLTPSSTRGGCLSLEIEARDRVGFLAALLRTLAYYSLFPVELQLQTLAGRARDQLWLRGACNSSPDPRIEKALEARLQALVRTGSTVRR